MSQSVELPLILGGHTFISQLGNDPPASETEQCLIVESCLDHGVCWFDTTYQPERVALGNVLHSLGRRDEATILAWNFFTNFGPCGPVGEAACYLPGHIDVILTQLRTSYVDCLVIVPLQDEDKNQRQEELLLDWLKQGYVRSLGLWIGEDTRAESYRDRKSYRFAIRPFNVTTDTAAGVFAACKKAGWETLATSPFFRGWELDRVIEKASACGYGDSKVLRPMLADLMLRYALFQPGVDRVIVGMRKVDWITQNIESVARGPLTLDEKRLLRRLAGKTHWWQRLFRYS